jgi:hypothetical protein
MILDEILSASSCKRVKLSSISQRDHIQQEKEHKVNTCSSEAGVYTGGKRLFLAAPNKDIVTEKQGEQCQGISHRVPSIDGRLSISTSPNCCSLASPMNALDDILYSQASPATGSTLTQSKDETGLQVAFVSFFTDYMDALIIDLLFRTNSIEVAKQPDVKRKYLQVSLSRVYLFFLPLIITWLLKQ